jgi:peptide/nickel transport system substrate-binding protein
MLVLFALSASCTAAKAHKTPGVPLRFARGGILRVAATTEQLEGGLIDTGPVGILDPQRAYSSEPFEILRCCLVRTLYQYSGKPTSEGGTRVIPDLATSLPTVSADGLTWTIHIKPGIHYGPPLQSQVVVAQDFVRALKRTAIVTQQDGGDYGGYYSIIEGFDAYANHKADAIAGVQTPDDHTLVVSLTARVGDLTERLTMPAMSPIPSLSSAPEAQFGIATGHDDGFGRFLVATGPYMIEGSDALTPQLPAKQQKPAAGALKANRIITLVRNPSWVASTDDIRPAYADRIVVKGFDTVPSMQSAIDKGSVDIMMFGGPPTDIDLSQAERYRHDPSLGRVLVAGRDSVRYAFMNVAVQPFDDIHVRKAANFVVNKQAYINAFGGPLAGQPPTHIVLDSLENNLLVDYDPYRSDGPSEALTKAKDEMRLSRYDHDHNGVCDAAACKKIRALAFGPPAQIAAARSVARDLAKIGVELDVRPLDGEKFFRDILDPSQRTPIGLAPAWSKDYVNAAQFIGPLLAGPQLGELWATTPQVSFNYGQLGRSSSELRRWGYKVTKVPRVDDRIKACANITGQPQLLCWTALDQYLTEQVVPWIPLILENSINVIPARVVNFSIDQWTTMPALDQIVVRPSSPSAS